LHIKFQKSGKVFSCFLFLCLFFFSLLIKSSAQQWEELKGEHFLVYFTQGEKFAKEVLDKAEKYYRQIALDLGYSRYSEFWTWDKRVKIYIYPDHDSYLKATGEPKWTQGIADYKTKEIISYAWSAGFVESLLPHEMAHLIFRDFVGFKGEVPLWLDEGVAQWEEEAKRNQIKAAAKYYFKRSLLLSVEDMMQLDIRSYQENDRIYIRTTRTKDGKQGVLLLSSKNLIDTYYLQSVSLVGFLIERYGSDSFAHFCRQLRDGKTLAEALQFSYPTYIHNVQDLEDRWRDYLEAE